MEGTMWSQVVLVVQVGFQHKPFPIGLYSPQRG